MIFLIFKIGGSLGLLTGMRLITGLELLFWFLAMITRICFKFEGKEKQNNEIDPALNKSAAATSQRKLRRDNKLRARKQPFTTVASAPKDSDDAKWNRIDTIEDTIKKINLKLEIIENDLSKTNDS